MKKLLFFILLFFASHSCFSQAYIPMPADSGATWRYRIYDIDYLTQVFDNIIFLNGQDTFANGNTYHKLISRTCRQAGGPGFDPPVVPVEATTADVYYGAMRESGKQVFLLTMSGEELMFDFNVAANDSIPAYSGKNKVTAVDSVLLSGVYHKRYLTTDSGYYVIEGIGSSRGLIPGMNDGSGTVRFYCFTDGAFSWSPDSTIPCTYVYPVGYVSAVTNINNQLPEINVYPIPANEVLHITATGQDILHVAVLNCMGQAVWSGEVAYQTDIPVSAWPKGVYYMQLSGGGIGTVIKKVIVE